MRILFFTDIPSPYRIDFFNKLNKNNEVTVLFDGYITKGRNENWNKGKEYNFNYAFIKNKRQIIKYIKKFRNDVVVITNYSEKNEMIAIAYMKIKKIKYFMEIDGGFIKKDGFFKKKLKKFLISSASMYISPSEMADRYLINYGANKKNIKRYKFSSVNRPDLSKNVELLKEKNELRKELNLKEKIIIVAVGQFIYRKGFDLLIKASKEFNDEVGVYIIGDNPKKEYIDLCDSLNCDKVHFVGFQSSDSLKKYYAAADIFVLPTREDIWGLVVNEAVSFGLPVITTNMCLSGVELIKNGEGGYIVDVDNVEQIVESVNKLSGDKNLRDKIKKNNLKLAEEYTIDGMVEQNEKIFSEGF